MGADNGIGAAAALAVLAAQDIAHGPIEALFTATEETGMDGAKGLQGGWLKGDVLLNLDSETLGEVCIGCAGGVDGTFTLPMVFRPNTQVGFTLTVKGLKGGHSGIDIIKQRGNAIKILVRLLERLRNNIRLTHITGGNLRNAIPREAEALFASDQSLDNLQARVDAELVHIRRGLPADDRNITATIAPAPSPARILTKPSQRTLLDCLSIFPNGVDRMSIDVKGLAETSTNLARIHCEDNALILHCLLRSLDDNARDDLADRMAKLTQLAGGQAEFSGAYTGWQPVSGSPLIDVVVKEGEKLLGKTPDITVIHAGLECGLLSQHYPHWQMVSFGPTIEMPHSPDERVHIESVEKFWQWLVNILQSV